MTRVKKFYTKISPTSAVIFLIIILGALFVRLSGLTEFAFTDDETWHLVVADQKSFFDVIEYNFQEEVHPPLSYLIWHYMLKISHNDLWLRMSSIIPGLLLIPSAYIFARLYIGGRAAAYVTAFIFAFGAMPAAISTVIRAYSLMMLALVWAAIFIHKYRFENNKKQRDKYLIGYFVSAFVAVELNHSAALAIFSLGLILFSQALKEKNRREFIAISIIHAVLGILVVGYAFILKHYYGFSGLIPGFFCSFSGDLYYLENYLKLFFWFPIGSEINDFFAGIFSLFAIMAFFVTPIALIRARKWALLQMMFVPLCVVILTDYFKIFPFSPSPRNNLFLIFSIVVPYAYFAQICTNYLARFYPEKFLQNKKNILRALQISVAIVTTIFFSFYSYENDFFRKNSLISLEFVLKKSDIQDAYQALEAKNVPSNVFVTASKNIWFFRMKSGDRGRITVLTKHLAKFESDEIVIYFSAFPARDYSTNISMLEYKLFFQDLFVHLESEKKMSEVKTFTFFDIGLGIDHLTLISRLSFVPYPMMPYPAVTDKVEYDFWAEGYNMGWAIQTSKEVVDKFYKKDPTFDYGREIFILSFTPKFVQDEILSKDFIDWRMFDKARRGL